MISEWHLEDLGHIVTGKTPPKAVENAYSITGTPFITPKDMDGRKWVSSTERNLSKDGLASVKSSIIPAGSIAVSCIGSDMGKAVMVPIDSVTNQQINSIIPDKKRCDPEFLYYLLTTMQQGLKDIAGGSATPILNKGHFGKVQVELPCMSHQIVAAKILSALDDKIQLNQQINQTLEQMAQAIFKSWFVDFEPVKAKVAALEAGGSEDDALLAAMQVISGKDPQQFTQLQTENPEHYTTLRATAELFPAVMQESELGEIPDGWEAGDIGKVTTAKGGYAFKGKDFIDIGNPVIKIKNINYSGVVNTLDTQCIDNQIAKTASRFKLSDGDILMAMTGATVGKSGIYVSDGRDSYVNQRVAKFESKINVLEPCWFTYNLINKETIFEQIVGAAQGSAQPNISSKGIEQVQTVVPDTALIQKYQNVVAPFYKKWISNSKENLQLSMLRDTLLPKLLSAELVVTVSDKDET